MCFFLYLYLTRSSITTLSWWNSLVSLFLNTSGWQMCWRWWLPWCQPLYLELFFQKLVDFLLVVRSAMRRLSWSIMHKTYKSNTQLPCSKRRTPVLSILPFTHPFSVHLTVVECESITAFRPTFVPSLLTVYIHYRLPYILLELPHFRSDTFTSLWPLNTVYDLYL